jgi:hypothetical protein
MRHCARDGHRRLPAQRRLRNFNVPDMRRSGAGDYQPAITQRRLRLSAIVRMAMIHIKENPQLWMLCAASKVWQHVRRELIDPLCDPYRPEQHYMRGPGPKCRAKALNVTARRPRIR